MVPKKPNMSWLVWLVKVAMVTTGVGILSFGAACGGSKLWSFFSPPAVPPQTPHRMYSTVTVGSPAEADSPAETTKEAGSDEDFTYGIAGGSHTTNLIETNTTLTAAESYAKYEIRKRKALIRELESRISISTSKTAEIESDWNYLRGIGFSEEFISEDPIFKPFPVEESIRNVHRAQIQGLQNEINEYLTNPREPTEEEKQKQKNEILWRRIRLRQGRIREINFLITKSNSITAKREAEWESTLTATARRARGLRKQIIMNDPAFKKLEKDKIRVLAGEQASCTTYRTKVWVLRERNEKDKKNIRELVAIPEEAEETSLPREEISLAIGPVTKFISTSCSSTRPILPIKIPKEKSPSASDSETPRIEWGRKS